MTPEGAGTKVDVATDLAITGKVAEFGRGVLVDVSSKLMGQFVENVERDVLSTAGGGDTSHAGGAYEQALGSVATASAHAAGARPEPRRRTCRPGPAGSIRPRRSPSTSSTSPAAR